MLSSLSIKNYLLIEKLDLDFNSGFSVITGETGAGKSIIIGAISLLLGKRADKDVLADKESKCIIEGVFNIDGLNLESIFKLHDLDYESNTIIRREILKEGKSRAFVNDTPVNLNILKSITEKLVDLHSQHENLALASTKYRLQVIDTAAETKNSQIEFKRNFEILRSVNSELKEAKLELENAKKDIDYYQFQADQLFEANLDNNNELEELENQSSLLENAEDIKTTLQNVTNIIDGSELSLDSMLSEIKTQLNRIAKSYKPTDAILKRIESIIIEARDLNEVLSDDIEKAEINPELLEKVNLRIDLLNNLLTKHIASDIAELKQKLNEYNSHILGTEEIENKISKLESTQQETIKKCTSLATSLSNKRKKSFPKIEKSIITLLTQLGMTHAVFKIENQLSEELTDSGYDNIKFLFSANKSIQAQTLDKVASGGEFSRLMLALKSLLAKSAKIPTIIFDEIDTGVSGEIASKMGRIMTQISSSFQVVSITHLPQVAAFGKHHYKVFKTTDKIKSQTNIRLLNSNERITEIASMISGEEMTVQAIENARILLQN